MITRKELAAIPEMLATSLRLVCRDVLLNLVSPSVLVPNVVRVLLYRAAGMKLRTFNIYPGCFFGGTKIDIGRGTLIGYKCFFDTSAPITIGDRCAIANCVQFITSTHAVGESARRAAARATRPIRVGDGCWIGAGAIILPGVLVGNGCVIAAGAVVHQDCEPDSLYAGVPAERIKSLTCAERDSDLGDYLDR